MYVKLCMYICFEVIVLCSPLEFREDAKKRYLQYTEQREQYLKKIKVNSMCTRIIRNINSMCKQQIKVYLAPDK